MQHAKTDSDVTSLFGSSPRRAGPAYYVQSPSRESNGERIDLNSFRFTPTGTPPHYQSPESSTTEGGSKGRSGGGQSQQWQNHQQRHHPFDAIEEESLLASEDEEKDQAVTRRCCYLIWFVVAFFALFSFFSLILWGVSRNQKPIISIKSIKFEQFAIQAGLDTYGVETAMASINATAKLVYQNRGTFFGIHVTSTPLQLAFGDLVIASGMMNYFYERRNSRRKVTVQVRGDRVPLYGAGYILSSNTIGPIPLTLSFRARSRAYVLGRLVRPKFYKAIQCALVMHPYKMNMVLSLKRNCTYT